MTSRSLEADLRQAIRGDVRFDVVNRGVYATDASIYQITPVGVVVPRDEEDVRAAMTVAARHEVSILARGGGTSLAGQTAGPSLVIDLSRHLNRILEINPDERWARVQPGVVRDELNAVLKPHGLHFSPDPATGNRATVGGMIANNSSGTRSIRYGKTIDHVQETRVLLADGTEHTFGELDGFAVAARAEGGDREAELYRGMRTIVDGNREEIAARFPKVMRRVAGYSLDSFLDPDHWNLSRLVTGSEGTLGMLLEARVHLDPPARFAALTIVHFRDLIASLAAVPRILTHDPSAVEILDGTFIRLTREHLMLSGEADFVDDDPAAILVVEISGDDERTVRDRMRGLVEDLRTDGIGYAWPVIEDGAGQARIWALRKAGLGIMLSMKGDRKPVPFIEDAAIPVEVLSQYIDDVLAACRKLGVDVAMYAHASVGVIHVRPMLDLKQVADIERMKAISEASLELVMRYGGCVSGEHGDGLSRSHHLETFYGPQLTRAFREVKTLFDARGLMNPGKIVDPWPMDENLRYGTDYETPGLETSFRYRHDGSFPAAVEMCSGVGACRKTLDGTMCPSFMATRDELHSTRGRANVLRLAMTGQLDGAGLLSDGVHEALDLCLACKACKAECPSSVDMAKLKSEVLQLRHDRHGTKLLDRLVGGSPEMAGRISGSLAPLINKLQSTGIARNALASFAAVDRRRSLPPYAREPFHRWFARRGRGFASGRQVALFVDTYLDYHEPQVGRAAVRLLESLGYEVEPARVGCCQRPRISRGLLREAAERGEMTLRGLDAFIVEGLPVVVCEPSCASALVDDLPDLVSDGNLARRVSENVQMIDQFVARELRDDRIPREFRSQASSVLIHGHCHQKALFGTDAMRSILGAVPDLSVTELDAGCCGMAGSFGYEHYDLSMKVGEDRLFPALRELDPDTAVVACGFSCRHQIADATGRRAVHWVEVVRGGHDDDPDGDADWR